MTSSAVAIILVVLFLAALTKSILGFGVPLVAMPLLTLTMNVQTASSIVGLYAALVSFVMLIGGWHQVDFRTSWKLILAAMLSIPIGVWGLKQFPEVWMRTALGVLVIMIGIYNLTRPKIITLKGDNWAFGFGAVSGLLAGAYMISGPPVIIYGTIKGWSPQKFRATLQSFFLPVNLMVVFNHAWEGFVTTEVLNIFALSIPVLLIALIIGNTINRRVKASDFEQLVYIALIVLGLLLI
jgi:uncharacterized protein